MLIYENVYNKIINLPPVPPECGGIIGGQNNIISEFVFDAGLANQNYDTYIPDVNMLNNIITCWKNEKVNFYGIVHTHRKCAYTLSHADKTYIKKLLFNNPFLERLYFPVVIPSQKIICYTATQNSGILIIQNEFLQVIERR